MSTPHPVASPHPDEPSSAHGGRPPRGRRLAGSASPYLRAHADNAVAWYPWGEEAFAEARRADVPVLVSIGYSTCHWCHVMSRESFDDPAIGEQLAADFVSIKVDREEHPDVDAAYLAAAGAFTPHLGWPLTVFATPDGRAFHAGTYFPPEPRQGVPSFRQVLDAVTEAWRERRGEVDGIADALAEALAQAAVAEPGDQPTVDALAEAARRLVDLEDAEHGGFGTAGPKFPMVPALRFLQAPALREAAPEAAATARRALDAMAGSALFDPVDGGFFRYATRPDWTVPHWERMLTDNAGLIEVALAAGDLDLAARIAGFLMDVLQQPSGGFGAAQDSESLIDGARSEGGYYAADPDARATLDPPAVDGKVVTGWNGLAIGALADLARRAGDADVLDAARAAADAVMESNVDGQGRLVRASLHEIASRAPAVVEDHGLLAAGLVRLAAAAGEVAYAATARDLVDTALAGLDPDPLLGSTPATSDGAHLSGPAALAEGARLLWLLGAGETYREAAESIVRDGATRALAEPAGHAGILRVAADLAVPPRQVVVVAEPDDDLAVAARDAVADLAITLTAEQSAAFAASGFELLVGKTTLDGRATAFVCREFTCDSPIQSAASLAEMLKEARY